MRTLALSLLGGVLAASVAAAQAATPAAAPVPAKAAATKAVVAPSYDAKAEVTVLGVVQDLHESRVRTDHPGIHLVVQTDTESVEVHTCPLRFMKSLDFAVAKGDTVKVVGSRPGSGGIVIARDLTLGQTSLSVRDRTGAPLW